MEFCLCLPKELSLARCRARPTALAHRGKETHQFLAPRGFFPPRHGAPAQHDDVEGGKDRLGGAKHLTHQALASISIHCPRNSLPPHDHAKPRINHAVRLSTHDEAMAGHRIVIGEYRVKLRAVGQARQPVFLCQGKITRGYRLDAEPRAPFRAAGANHCSAATCFHAHTKPMSALAAGFRGLIGSLHVGSPVMG